VTFTWADKKIGPEGRRRSPHAGRGPRDDPFCFPLGLRNKQGRSSVLDAFLIANASVVRCTSSWCGVSHPGSVASYPATQIKHVVLEDSDPRRRRQPVFPIFRFVSLRAVRTSRSRLHFLSRKKKGSGSHRRRQCWCRLQ
jgi:hypothetical protein